MYNCHRKVSITDLSNFQASPIGRN